MKRRTRVLLGLVASLAATTGLMATTAGAAQAVGGHVPVTAYDYTGVHRGPGNYYDYLYGVYPGDTMTAICWDHGQPVSDNGYTNDVWIKLADSSPRVPQWISAVYLKGDEHANVPWFCNHETLVH